MSKGSVDVLDVRPDGLSRWAYIQFGPDYSAEHPVWTLDGLADLDAMRLPSEIEMRLHRWASYWDDNHDFETGWPAGLPEAWWLDEQRDLPCDLATTIGNDAVVISVEGRMLRSRTAGTAPEAAAAMRDYITAGEAEDRRFAEDRASGYTFASNVMVRFRPRRRDTSSNDG